MSVGKFLIVLQLFFQGTVLGVLIIGAFSELTGYETFLAADIMGAVSGGVFCVFFAYRSVK